MQAPATTDGFPQASSPQYSSARSEWRALLQFASPGSDLDRLASLVQHAFDWTVFLQRAKEHGVLPLVAAQVNRLDHALVPPDVFDQLRELRRAHTVFALQLTAELFRLLTHFANAGIQ